jgi:hypothetical protein
MYLGEGCLYHAKTCQNKENKKARRLGDLDNTTYAVVISIGSRQFAGRHRRNRGVL